MGGEGGCSGWECVLGYREGGEVSSSFTITPRAGKPAFCPTCGVGLNEDGTVTPMVPAVTREAVQEAVASAQSWDEHIAIPRKQWNVILAALQQAALPEGKVLVDEADLRLLLSQYEEACRLGGVGFDMADELARFGLSETTPGDGQDDDPNTTDVNPW